MEIKLEKSKYHRFSLYYNYEPSRVEFCRQLKESFGWDRFSFDASGELKRWVFSDSLFVPILVERFPEVQIDPQVVEIVKREQEWTRNLKEKEKKIDEIREKKDTEFNVKGLKKEMYAYQKVGTEFLLESGGRAIIADSPGLGKTIQALAYVKHMGYKRVLAVCPASVKFSWETEVAKWTNLKSFVIDSKTNLAKIPADVQVWIINYDILKKHYDQLAKIHFDSLIGDECVIPQTYIATMEGQKQVVDLKIGEEILTYNIEKKIYEYKPLVAIVKKPILKPLVQVENLICTDDHPIFDGEKFVDAKDSKTTFSMGFLPMKMGSSDEVLAGCILGDGGLAMNSGKCNARLRIGNSVKNKDYIEMKRNVIKELHGREIKKVWNAGYKPDWYLRVQTLCDPKITSLRRKTWKNGKRIVTNGLLDMLGAGGLAIWLQDDASVNKGVTSIFTYRYGKAGNAIIKRWFKKKYGICPSIFIEKKKDGRSFYYLQFGVEDSLKIYIMIRDYIVPSMRYKFVSLEEKFNKIHINTCKICGQRMFGLHHKKQNSVGNQKFCSSCRRKYGTRVSYYYKLHKEKKVPYDCVYDLQIEDNHNFFADGILVHNCQLIKSPKALRTKAFRAISRNIGSIILLSGTPLLSRPSELFSLLNIIDMKTWNNWYEYARKYCAMHQTRWGLDTSGASNIEELHARIKRYFIRRDKTEVLKELPPKNFIQVPIRLEGKFAKQYDSAANDLAEYLRAYTLKEDPEIAKSLSAEKLTQLNILRQLNAMGKVDTSIELIESILDAGEKVLVFCSFVEPLELLKSHFGNSAVILTGQTPVDERREIVNSFQSDKNISVFLGGIKSAGVGITLTAASNVIFLDYSWNPADHQQAQDRVHRPGQTASSVNIYQVFATDTIDEDLKEILDNKQAIFDKVIDGKVVEKKAKDAMDSAVKRILKNY